MGWASAIVRRLRRKAWAALEWLLWPRRRVRLWRARRAELAEWQRVDRLEKLGHRPRDGPA